MAATPEAKVKAAVVKVLKEHDVYYFFPATYGMGRSGVPDIVCCVNGKFLAIECKAGNNIPTALQVNEMNKIQRANGVALVIYGNSVGALSGILKLIGEPEQLRLPSL